MYTLVHGIFNGKAGYLYSIAATLEYRGMAWRRRWPRSKWRTRPRQRQGGSIYKLLTSIEDAAATLHMDTSSYVSNIENKLYFIQHVDVPPRGYKATEEIFASDVAFRTRMQLGEIAAA